MTKTTTATTTTPTTYARRRLGSAWLRESRHWYYASCLTDHLRYFGVVVVVVAVVVVVVVVTVMVVVVSVVVVGGGVVVGDVVECSGSGTRALLGTSSTAASLRIFSV